MRKRTNSIALILFTLVLGAIVYTRFPSLHLRAASSHVNGPYPTEEAWIVNEIVRDVVEMSAYPAGMTAPAVTSASDAGLPAHRPQGDDECAVPEGAGRQDATRDAGSY